MNPVEAFAGRLSLRGRIAGLFLLLAVALAPWTVWLFLSLPSRHLAAHWDLAWGGFDVLLVGSLSATAVAALRRSPWLRGAACATAALLVVDAWFDVTTSTGATRLFIAAIEAAFVEIPLAFVCLYSAGLTPRLASRRPVPRPAEGGLPVPADRAGTRRM